MDTTPEHPQPPETKEAELMKSLTLGIVGDLGRLLKEEGLGQTPIKIMEALIFAMFMVTEAFMSVKGGLEEARGALDLFHEDMLEYMFHEYFYKHQKAKDMQEVEERFHQTNQLVNERYQEYRQQFMEDLADRETPFQKTFAGLTGHLFPETLPPGEEQDRLLNLFSVKLAYFWGGCINSFRPQPD